MQFVDFNSRPAGDYLSKCRGSLRVSFRWFCPAVLSVLTISRPDVNEFRDSELGALRSYRNNQSLVVELTKAEIDAREPILRRDAGLRRMLQ